MVEKPFMFDSYPLSTYVKQGGAPLIFLSSRKY